MKIQFVLLLLSTVFASAPGYSDPCLTFLNELDADSAALRPSVKRVYQVLTFLSDLPEYEGEVEEIKNLIPLNKLRKSRHVHEIVGTQNEAMRAIDSADQLTERTEELHLDIPALATFNEDLRIILYFKFRDLREVEPRRFSFLKSYHQFRYLEFIKRESLSEVVIPEAKRDMVQDKIKQALYEEEALWHDTILEDGYALKTRPKVIDVSVYRANGSILAYRLAITAKGVDRDGSNGRLHVIKYYDEMMNEIESGPDPAFAKFTGR